MSLESGAGFNITKLDYGGLLNSQIGIFALFFNACLRSIVAASAVDMNRVRTERWVALVVTRQGILSLRP